jgi:arsenate reductase
VLQEAFARSLDKVPLGSEESAVAWFYRVLRNAVLDHYRRAGASDRALLVRLLRRARLHRLHLRRALPRRAAPGRGGGDAALPLAGTCAAPGRCRRRGASRRPDRNTGSAMKRVIFACLHNAGRSQMAAAFFNLMADPAKAVAISAGTRPAERVHPEVLAVMREIGIDLSSAQPRKFTAELAQGASWLVTMGCGDECPVVPGARRDDWPLADPKGQPLDQVRQIRDEIERRVAALMSAERWSVSARP